MNAPLFSVGHDDTLLFHGHVIGHVRDWDFGPLASWRDLVTPLRLDFSPGRFRPTAHTLCVHEMFGPVLALATDGVWVAIADAGVARLVHRTNLRGPIVRRWVSPWDWDFVANRQRMLMFERADGTLATYTLDPWENWSTANPEGQPLLPARRPRKESARSVRARILKDL